MRAGKGNAANIGHNTGCEEDGHSGPYTKIKQKTKQNNNKTNKKKEEKNTTKADDMMTLTLTLFY